MLKRFWCHSETMALAFIVWLCGLPLVLILVAPTLGLAVAGGVAAAMLAAVVAICWGICGWRLAQNNRQ